MNAMAIALERVHRDAKQLDPVRVALTLIAVPFFVLGWVAAKSWAVAWTGLAWAVTAVTVGWKMARGEDT